MKTGGALEGKLALACARNALAQGLLESAQCLALLAACHGPQPSAEALSLVGAACMAAGEAKRALHFLEAAQRAFELTWGPSSDVGGSAGLAQAAATAAGPSAGPTAGGMPAMPSAAALLSSIADCHERLGEWSEALAALERIPPPQRCARTWARLGRLHAQSASGHLPAIAAYKACLRLCPYALEAALALAELRVPADEVCGLLSGMALPSALHRLLQQSAQLQALAAAQLAGQPAAAARAGSGAPQRKAVAASLEQQLAQQLSSQDSTAGAGRCRTAALGAQPGPERPRMLPPALAQAASRSMAAAAAAEQTSCQQPVSAQHRGLLLCESACQRELGLDEAAAVAGSRAAAAAGDEQAEEDGVHTPPASSPVAVVRASPFTPSPGQGLLAGSPARQQWAVPCQPSSPCSSPPSVKARGGLPPQQQQPQLQPLAAQCTLHLRSQPEPTAPAQQQPPPPAGCAAAAKQRAASPPAQLGRQQDDEQQGQHGELEPCIPEALLEAAQRNLGCLSLMVRLAAALAAEDKGRALPMARQLLDVAPRHPLALVLAARCQADHGSTASALLLYERARQADPYSLAGAARHADLLRQAGDSVALADLVCQLSADAGQAGAGGRPEPWVVAAHAKELAGDLYEAVGLLRKALERDPGCPEAHLHMGRLLQRVHAATGAAGAAGTAGTAGLADFEAALRLAPSARAFREADARRLARQAVRAFPTSLACRLLRAQVLGRDPRRVGQAEALLRQALREEPRCEEAVLILAVLLVHQGRRREAEALLSEQLAEAPSLAVAVIAGRMALEAGRLGAAVGHFTSALGHSPFSQAATQGLQEVEALLAPPRDDSSDSEAGGDEGAGADGAAGDDPFYSYDTLP
ncbi:hypothetical protein ABPG75_006173 [Micractinium tetrahymenae]